MRFLLVTLTLSVPIPTLAHDPDPDPVEEPAGPDPYPPGHTCCPEYSGECTGAEDDARSCYPGTDLEPQPNPWRPPTGSDPVLGD